VGIKPLQLVYRDDGNWLNAANPQKGVQFAERKLLPCKFSFSNIPLINTKKKHKKQLINGSLALQHKVLLYAGEQGYSIKRQHGPTGLLLLIQIQA